MKFETILLAVVASLLFSNFKYQKVNRPTYNTLISWGEYRRQKIVKTTWSAVAFAIIFGFVSWLLPSTMSPILRFAVHFAVGVVVFSDALKILHFARIGWPDIEAYADAISKVREFALSLRISENGGHDDPVFRQAIVIVDAGTYQVGLSLGSPFVEWRYEEKPVPSLEVVANLRTFTQLLSTTISPQ